jgi:DHA2 family multidrug resistance protein
MSSLYIRGFAMGIMFTPLNQISFLTIPHDKMAQASSITNTIRQIGGSVGVAFLTTVLTARISFHSQVYGEAIQARSQEFSNVIHHLSFFVQQHLGSSMPTALQQGKYLLLSNVNNQAFIEGVNDDFLLAALITLLGVIPVIILKTKKKSVTSQLKTQKQ